MKVLIQNLQKKQGLASHLIQEYEPDVMLAQEINLPSEEEDQSPLCPYKASNTSYLGFGTAIYSKTPITNIRTINSPYHEFGGFIRKRTTVANSNGIQFVSFHGYNGIPFRNKTKHVSHVKAVLTLLSSGPAVFAGDFNTWSQDHLDSIVLTLKNEGFELVFSWPYKGRKLPLDHVFLRNINLLSSTFFSCPSDHFGALVEIDAECNTFE
jgi:endonuclease/exonuclease/phosphatase (EEP) superfamily protein YafD